MIYCQKRQAMSVVLGKGQILRIKFLPEIADDTVKGK